MSGIIVSGSELLYHALPRIRKNFPDIRIIDQQFNDTGHIENNRRYAHLIDQTVVPSRALADLLVQQHGADPHRVKSIPHAVQTSGPLLDPETAFRLSGLPAHCRGKLLVSFFGRMSKEKAPDIFVAIAARLAHRRDLYFVMTGEGPEWPAVQQMIARYGLQENVYLPGFVEDVRPLMQASGIVVLTSLVDGMPLVLLEAQAMGKPVVSSSVGSIPEMVIHRETGFLCRAGDVKAFCDAIENLADEPALRQSFSERARELARRRYSASAMVESYLVALGVLNGVQTETAQ